MTGTASVGSKIMSADAERPEAAVCAKLATVINFELPSTWLSTVLNERLVKLSTGTGSATPTPPDSRIVDHLKIEPDGICIRLGSNSEQRCPPGRVRRFKS